MNGGEINRRVAEREAADRRYNEALTAVDDALPHLPGPSPREIAVAPARPALRQGASILPREPPLPAGWRGRLAGFIWRLVAPVFERQQAFNAALSEEMDRLEAARADSARALEDATATWRRHLDAFFAFDSRLVQFLQQITPFVDTRIRVVDQSLSELRMAAAAAQRSAVAARGELERLRGGAQADEPPGGSLLGPRAAPHDAGAHGASYIGFEDLFRGTSEEIRRRQRDDADRFLGASDVVDVGCGRGEFLELLRERQVTARGIDANPEMARICRARGLDVRHGDALAYLTSLPDNALGGLMAAQVLEHLEPDYLVRLIEVAHAKLRPGALIVLETINAACWVAFFESYIRDITHVRPLHPDTLKFLVVAAGFERVDIHFRSPIAEDGRLQSLATPEVPGPLADVARIFNGNVERLNERLFTYHDYAVIGVKGQ
jgi:SAM-dependent methyltransferase